MTSWLRGTRSWTSIVSTSPDRRPWSGTDVVSPQVGSNISSALSRSPAWPRVIDVPPLKVLPLASRTSLLCWPAPGLCAIPARGTSSANSPGQTTQLQGGVPYAPFGNDSRKGAFYGRLASVVVTSVRPVSSAVDEDAVKGVVVRFERVGERRQVGG